MTRATLPAALAVALGAAALPPLAAAQDPRDATLLFPAIPDATPAIVAAAEAFLATLSAGQRDLVLFDFSDDEQRANWTNFPDGAVLQRQGIRWGDMDDAQQAALTALLGSVLSFDGLRMVQEQMAADDVVAALDAAAEAAGLDTGPSGGGDDDGPTDDDGGPEGADDDGPPDGERPPVNFGSAYYYVSMLGEPSETEPFMIQFGGHHLAVNATVVGPDVTLSPTLTGGEPLKFTLNGRDVYIVEEEAVQAAAFLAALDEAQREAAVVSDERADLVLGPGHDGEVLQPEGVFGADLDRQQRAQLLELIEARLGILNADDLAATMAPVEANLDETAFAWFGPTEPLGAAYWRVVGPTVILEFSPQVNDGDPTDHAHNMYRDPTNEYGAGLTALD